MRESYMFYTDKLEGEYKKVFEQIDLYVNTQFVDNSMIEEMMSELLDMFLNAQASGKPVKKIVGSNVEEFCKMFCAEFGLGDKMKKLMDSVEYIAFGMLIISLLEIICVLIDYADGTVVDFWSAFTSLNVSRYILGLIVSGAIGFLTDFIVRKIMFRFKKISMNILKVITTVTMIAVLLIILTLIGSQSADLFRCPLWLITAISAGYLVFYYIFNFRRVKADKAHKVRFGDMVRVEIRKDFPETMQKIYNRKNKRNIRKGKGELSVEEFIRSQEKSCNMSDKFRFCYLLFPPVLTAVITGIMWFKGGFETPFDTVVFAVLLLAIEYPIMMFFRKIDKDNTAMTRAWIKEKREEQ